MAKQNTPVNMICPPRGEKAICRRYAAESILIGDAVLFDRNTAKLAQCGWSFPTMCYYRANGTAIENARAGNTVAILAHVSAIEAQIESAD